MADVSSKNGVIILSDADTYIPENNSEIYAIIISDPTGGNVGTLTDGNTDVIFSFPGMTAGSFWYGIYGALNTGLGLAWSSTGSVAYIYVK